MRFNLTGHTADLIGDACFLRARGFSRVARAQPRARANANVQEYVPAGPSLYDIRELIRPRDATLHLRGEIGGNDRRAVSRVRDSQAVVRFLSHLRDSEHIAVYLRRIHVPENFGSSKFSMDQRSRDGSLTGEKTRRGAQQSVKSLI